MMLSDFDDTMNDDDDDDFLRDDEDENPFTRPSKRQSISDLFRMLSNDDEPLMRLMSPSSMSPGIARSQSPFSRPSPSNGQRQQQNQYDGRGMRSNTNGSAGKYNQVEKPQASQLPQIRRAIMFSGDDDDVMKAVTQVKLFLDGNLQSNIQKVIDAGLVPPLIRCMSRVGNQNLQMEALLAIGNIVTGTTRQTLAVIEEGGVPVVIRLTLSRNADLRENALWTIGNIAVDSTKTRNMVINDGMIEKILPILNYELDNKEKKFKERVKHITWIMKSLCIGSPNPPLSKVAILIEPLKKVFHFIDVDANTDADMLSEICETIASICKNGSSQKSKNDTSVEHVTGQLCELSFCSKFVKLLDKERKLVRGYVLEALQVISGVNKRQVLTLIECDMVQKVKPLLSHGNQKMKKSSCMIMSNVASKSPDQTQKLFQADIISLLLVDCRDGDESIQEAASNAISNIIIYGSIEQVKKIASNKCLGILFSQLIKCSVINVGQNILLLKAIETILDCGQLSNGKQNTYLSEVQEKDINNLKLMSTRHPKEKVREKSKEVYDRFFAVIEQEKYAKMKEEEKKRREIEEKKRLDEMQKLAEIEQKNQEEKRLRDKIKKIISLSDQIKMPLNRGKIIITGPGAAGKTSTVRSLKGEPFVKDHISTIGADTKSIFTMAKDEVGVSWNERGIIEGGEFVEQIVNVIQTEKRYSIKPSSVQSTTVTVSVTEQNTFISSTSTNPESSGLDNHHSVSASTKDGDKEEQEPNKPRRPSLMQRLRNSFTSKASASAATDDSSDAKTTTKSKSEVNKTEEFVDKSKNISMKDDQDAVNVHTMDLVAKGVGNKEKSKNKENIALSIWDLGGQDVFYTLHHLFLTKFAVYLCVFDMTHMISNDKQVRENSLEYTNFWLRSIQMHANGAPIFLIGTRKDMVNKDDQHEKINDILEKFVDEHKLSPNFVKNGDILFWPIDNSKGVEGDLVLAQLRTEIMNAVLSMEHIKKTVPLLWTLIYDKLIETKKKNMAMSEVVKLSNKYGINDEKDISEMLKFFNNLGMLLHFDKTKELRDLVILEPQWIVDALTMVIRDFQIHKYPKELTAEIKSKFKYDFELLKNHAIATLPFLYRLWKSEDDESDVDYTRRKFLVSIMEQMTLSSPWRFNNNNEIKREEEKTPNSDGEENTDEFMPVLPPPTQYLIPSNLRLFRGKEEEKKLKKKINKEIQLPIISDDDDDDDDKICDPITPNCFVIDFSQSFLPIGLFDRLVCLLVAYSSACFKESRPPLVGSGSVLMSFGMNDFRLDEDIHKSRITATMHPKCKHQLVLQIVESMVAKLKKEVMGPSLKHSFEIVVWKDHGKRCCLIDLIAAKDAVDKKIESVRDITNKLIDTSEFNKIWIISEESEKAKEINQNMPSGKTHHGFIIHSNTDKIKGKIKEIAIHLGKRNGVKLDYDMSSIDTIKKGIDSAMSLIVLLDKDTVDGNDEVRKGLSYAIKDGKMMPCILLYDEKMSLLELLNKAEAMNPTISRIECKLSFRYRYAHEKYLFHENLCHEIYQKCGSVNEYDKIKGDIIGFLSHVKKEAGKDARILKDHGERYLSSVDGPFKGSRLFLDSDNLTDLNGLLEDVKKMKVMVVLLSKSYLTKPWCLIELYTAIKSGIKIVTVIIPDGDEYNATIAKNKIVDMTADKVLNECRSAIDALVNNNIDVNHMATTIADHLPKILALEFNANKPIKSISGDVEAIMDKMLEEAIKSTSNEEQDKISPQQITS